MNDAPSTDVAGFETALTAERVAGAAYLAAQRCATRDMSLMPVAAAPGQPSFAATDAARRPLAVLSVRTQPVAGRGRVTVSASVEPAAGPAAHAAVSAFVTALQRALAELDPSVREVGGTAAAAPMPFAAPTPFPAPPAAPAPSRYPAPSFAVPPPFGSPPPPPPFGSAPPPPPFGSPPPPPAPSFAVPPPPPPPPSFAAAPPPPSFAVPPPPPAPSVAVPPPAPSFSSPPPPPPATSFAPPAETTVSQHDEDDEDSEATVLTPRNRAAQAPWQLRLPDGTTRTLPVLAVVGRRPVAPASHPGAQPLVLPDPERMLSKSHALLESDTEGIWVTDLGSTNGTTHLPASGPERECGAGERVRVAPGDALLIAEVRVEITP